MDAIEIYRDAADELRWRYKRTGNRTTLADSGEGYGHLADVFTALQAVFEPDSFTQADGVVIGLNWENGRELQIRRLDR